MPDELEPRKGEILRAVVVEYIRSAEPVGSEAIARGYPGLGVKAATVRNEMADLLEQGFLAQPHTSAGRIPSDAGYRFYVDTLGDPIEPTHADGSTVSVAASQNEALVPVLRDTLRALTRLVHLLGVATTVRDPELSVRTALVSALGPAQALLVVALSNGQVENRMVECPSGLTLEDVGRANEALATLAGANLRTVAKAKAPVAEESPAHGRLTGLLWAELRQIAREQTRGRMVAEGEEFLFAQPEFRGDADALAELLNQLLEGDTLYEAVAPGERVTTVTIGRENRSEKLHRLSVVRRPFYVGGREAGVIALVGPTRMRYRRGVGMVDFTAKALSASLTRFLG